VELKVEAEDLEGLLYSWLEQLLIKLDSDNLLFSAFAIERLEKTVRGYELRAKARGERFDPRKHISKAGIKAVTYHMMEIRKEDGVKLRVLFDL
jgi:SHS2 domain-containing protein